MGNSFLYTLVHMLNEVLTSVPHFLFVFMQKIVLEVRDNVSLWMKGQACLQFIIKDPSSLSSAFLSYNATYSMYRETRGTRYITPKESGGMGHCSRYSHVLLNNKDLF